MTKQSIYGLTFEQLSAWLLQFGHKKFRARQVWEWLYIKRATDFSQMVDVNQACIEVLKDNFFIQTLQLHLKQEAADGTVKFLFKLNDGNLIETVLMRQQHGRTVCVTTQVGCNIGCSFCASGLIAKSRDLTSGEIVEQIMRVQQHLDHSDEKVTHVVVMGIGEPFDNYDHLVTFISILNNQFGLDIAPRYITVSTSGLAKKIYDYADDHIQAKLAISLHAPNNELRTSIMKINRAIPIEELMKAVDYYIEKSNKRVMFEYILLRDINDQAQHAKELARLMAGRKRVSVNLIPYNPVDEYSQYKRSDKETILAFYKILRENGIHCTIRQEHGTGIDAACGQLRSKQMKL